MIDQLAIDRVKSQGSWLAPKNLESSVRDDSYVFSLFVQLTELQVLFQIDPHPPVGSHVPPSGLLNIGALFRYLGRAARGG